MLPLLRISSWVQTWLLMLFYWSVTLVLMPHVSFYTYFKCVWPLAKCTNRCRWNSFLSVTCCHVSQPKLGQSISNVIHDFDPEKQFIFHARGGWKWVNTNTNIQYYWVSVAVLQVLWAEERAEKNLTARQSFVDLGCGNGLLVHILTNEGVRLLLRECLPA